MQKFKKHIACFLLLVFSWVLMPASLAHEAFADHIDTDCHFDHNKSTASVESTHTHCHVFETNTPIYDVPKFIVCADPIPNIILKTKTQFQNSYFHLAQLNLPTRAPPQS